MTRSRLSARERPETGTPPVVNTALSVVDEGVGEGAVAETAVAALATEIGADLVVIGPEAPLVVLVLRLRVGHQRGRDAHSFPVVGDDADQARAAVLKHLHCPTSSPKRRWCRGSM